MEHGMRIWEDHDSALIKADLLRDDQTRRTKSPSKAAIP